MFLPFFHKYPYTNFEQLNLDWLMEHVGEFDGRLTAVETSVSDLNTRVGTVENDIVSLQGRVTENETDILSLKGRVTTNENDISDLKGRVSTNENDISDLKGRMSGAESNISAIDTRLSGDESTINGIRSDLNDLDSQVDSIPIVSANPGGTGSTLNTIGIGGTVYSIPSGGGGGGGSSVTPNPSGTPTDDLESVDIDGTIYAIAGGGTTVIANPGGVDNPDLTSVTIGGTAYDIPVTDISGVQSDITSLDGRLDDAESDIDALEALTAFLSEDITTVTVSTAQNVSNLSAPSHTDSTGSVTLTPGIYLLRIHNEILFGNSAAGGALVATSVNGLPTHPEHASVEGYTYGENARIRQDFTLPVKITSNTNISLRTTINRQSTALTSATLYGYIAHIKLR